MDRTEAYYRKMTKTPVMKLVVTLGIPTTISMLITNIYNLVDTYFVGGLGESQQGAVGVLFTLQCIIQAFSFMIGHGSGVHVSKALADKDIPQATSYSSTAFFSGALVGTILGTLGLVFLRPFALLLGSTKTILPYAMDYGMWVCISCPFVVCSFILNNILRYEGKAAYAMIGIGAGGIINILGDWILITKVGLGVFGAGLATAVSQFISFIILLIMFFKSAQSRITIRAISLKIKDYYDICRVGLPSMIRQGLTSISNGLLNNLARPFGDAAIAALSVINRFSSLVLCVGLGIGQGFQPVASFNYQAKEYTRVKKAMMGTMAIGICFMGLMAVLGIIFPAEIVSIFQKSPDVIRIGKFGLRAASIGSMFMPVSVCINMLYQSIRHAGKASFLSMLRSGLVMIPALIILSHFFKLKGVLCAQPVADVVTTLICIPFVLHFLFKTPNTEKTDG